MTRVCIKWFPLKEGDKRKKPGFKMDSRLKQQIDILLKNITNDWDFTIIISGKGEVRVGKSVLAMQIAAYWCYMLEKLYGIKTRFDLEDNFIWDGRKLIQKGNYLGENYPYSPLIFDEAGADLEGRKAMQTITQDVLDFYRECGQYNLLNIIVLPEFFDLPKGVAMTRSIFLLNVDYWVDENKIFRRGIFRFYSKKKKKDLYLDGKRDLNYSVAVYNFKGDFPNFYPIDEAGYRKRKQEALRKRGSRKRNKFVEQRNAAWFLLHYEGLDCVKCGHNNRLTLKTIGQRMEGLTGIFVPHTTMSDAIRGFLTEDEKYSYNTSKTRQLPRV